MYCQSTTNAIDGGENSTLYSLTLLAQANHDVGAAEAGCSPLGKNRSSGAGSMYSSIRAIRLLRTSMSIHAGISNTSLARRHTRLCCSRKPPGPRSAPLHATNGRGASEYIQNGWYENSFARVDGRWKITRLLHTYQWITGNGALFDFSDPDLLKVMGQVFAAGDLNQTADVSRCACGHAFSPCLGARPPVRAR